ncbi:MAG: cupin domain-containing protein [Candidatus Eremiobacteraeota bacterium]|nr:cupin domain-containing protein [Candidatus Eremiobacteraeota bacterium]
MQSSTLAQAQQAFAQQRDDVITLFSHGTLQVKYYSPREVDDQTAHSRDEVYVVARGTGTFNVVGERIPFEPGTVLFVAAGDDHRFERFSPDFATWVFFYGPEGGEPAM